MNALFVGLAMLTSAASLWAQDQASGTTFQRVMPSLPSTSPINSSPDGLSVFQSFGLIDTPVQPLPSILALVLSLNGEISANTLNLIRLNFEATVNLSPTTTAIGQINFSTEIIHGGGSSGVEMIEASRTKGLIDTSVQPILLPPTDLQIQFNQAPSIQPAPEPSTFALGSLVLGLMAIVRFKKQQRIHSLKMNSTRQP